MATMNDVAKKAGVSVSTVSRVLNPSPNVTISAETQAKVRAAAEQLNYRTNLLAQGLRLNKFNNLGFLLCERSLDQMYYYNLLKAVENEASKTGLSLIFATLDDKHTPPMLNDSNIDGLLVTGRVTKEKIELIERAGVPFIVLGLPLDEQVDCNVVTPDPENEIFTALEYLLSHGHKKVAYISTYRDAKLQKISERGFRGAYLNASLPVEMDLLATCVEDPNRYFQSYLLEQRVTALVVQQQFVPQFYAFINKHKISIPQDLSVIIIGEDLLDPQAQNFYHYVSSRTKDVGTIAVEQLHRIWDKEVSYVNIKVSPFLHEGKSVLKLTEPLPKEA